MRAFPMTLHWHTAARICIAPRNSTDVKDNRGRWRYSEWSGIKYMVDWAKRSLRADDPAIAAVLARVVEFENAPTALTDDELAVFAVATGGDRTCEWLAEHFGTARVAPLLITPRFENVDGVIKPAKKRPNGDMLRILLASERDASVRAKCRELAQATWDAGDVEVHEHLAYAFFDDEAWRAQAAAEILDQAPKFDSRQLAIVRDKDAMRTLVARATKSDAIAYPEIVASLGEDALPILLSLAPAATGHARRLSHALAMSVIVNETSAKHLAKQISNPPTRKIIGDYFTHDKKLAAAVLPAASEGASRNAALAKELLIKICGDQTSAEPGETVALDDPAMPAVLRDAPWRKGALALPKLGLDVTTWSSRLEVSEEQKNKALAELDRQRSGKPYMNAEQLNEFMGAQGAKGSVYSFQFADAAIPIETVLAFYNAGRWSGTIDVLMLGAFGERALPGLRQTGRAAYLEREVRDRIDDAGIALGLATAWLARQHTWSWFEAQPRAAAFGLLAHVHEPNYQHACVLALRKLARLGHRETILSFVPTEHTAMIAELLDRDARLDVPSQSVKLGQAPHVKHARLRDGRMFADDAHERVLEILSFSPIEEPYAGLEDLKAACDPDSLAEMVWDLAAFADSAKRWRQDALEWMRWSLVHFANDLVIRRLTPALKHTTIHSVLEHLAIRGVRSASMEIATAHERGDAPHSMRNVATGLSTSVDAIVETLLPTTALAEEGTTSLEYGARTLQVGFDTTLAPILFLGEKRLAAIPRAQSSDDPIAIRLARERWDELKEDVRTIARLRARGLVDAMRSARRVPAPRFLAGWANHPLGKHQARAMVWAVERDGALVTFRVAEDSSLADIEDSALTLGDTELVRVPHFAELDTKTLDTWARTFTDYGLIQPVAQLARTPLPIAADDDAKQEIRRELSQPIFYSAFQRVLSEQGVSNWYQMSREQGAVQLHADTKWMNSKTMCTGFRLQVVKPLAELHPVERAEALYLLRSVLEAT